MAAGTMVRRIMLTVTADDADAVEKIDAIRAKADELRASNPELVARINTAEASAKMSVLRDELKAVTAETDSAPPMDIKVSSAAAQAKLDKIAARAEELRALNPAIIPRVDDMEASAKLAVLRGEMTATETESAGLGKAWEVTKFALLGVGAGLGYGIVKAAGFQQEITRLNTQAGVSKGQLKGLGDGVLQLAGQVGTSPDSLAEALFHVESSFASSGITGAKAMSLLKVAAEGARVGGADLVDTTNAVDAAVASGIPGVKNFSQAMGMLNAIVGSGDMTMQQLAESFGTGAVAAVKLYGLSLKDVGATLAVFGDNNIRGAQAGTQLRVTVESLAVPTAAGAKLLGTWGMSAKQLATDMQHGGLMPALKDLQAHFKAAGVMSDATSAKINADVRKYGANSAQVTADLGSMGETVTEIFGKKAGVGISLLMSQMDRLESKYPAITKGATQFGAAWNTQSKTPAQQLKDLEAGSEALATQLGENLLPAATKVLGWLNSFVQGLERGSPLVTGVAGVIGAVLAGVALKKLQDGLKGAVEGVEGLWSGGQKLIGFAAQMVGKLTAQTAATEAATVATEEETTATEEAGAAMTATPIGLITLAIAGLAIGIFELVKHWHDVTHATSVAFGEIKRLVGDGVDWIKGHWMLLGAILLGPIALATYEIGTHWREIVSGVQRMASDVTGWFKSLPGRILSAVGDLGHLLWNAGEQIINGLIGGIENMAGSAFSAVGNLGSGILHSAMSIFGIHSPSTEFYHIGSMITAGLSAGLRQTAQQAIDESRTLSAAVNQAAAEGLITPAEQAQLAARITAGLNSAVQRARKLSQDTGLVMQEGILSGLEGNAPAVRSAVSKLLAMVKQEMDAGMVSYPQASGLAKFLETDSSKLQILADARLRVLNEIKAADSYAASVTSKTEQSYGLLSVTSAPGGGAASEGQIIGGLQGEVRKIRQFAANIKKLSAMGLNKAYIDQLIQAGPDQGGPVAAELASGGLAEIRQINAAENAISHASTQLGRDAAEAMYDNGKQAGKGFLSGLEAQQQDIAKVMKKLADTMVGEIKKDLGIHSPSTVLREHGRMAGEGLALGIEDSVARVARSSHLLSGAITTGMMTAGGAGAGSGGTLRVEIVGGPGADAAFVTWLKKAIRIRGGNVQLVGA